MTIPISLLLSHWVGDFLLQSDWMALNKGWSLKALVAHVVVYSLCFLPWGWEFVAWTAIFHLITDAITSQVTTTLWTENKRHWFFVVIGLDQLIHYVTLALTLRLIS